MLRSRALIVLVACAAASCSSAPAPEPYAPGLGEIMTLQQMRHTKLWLAGEAGNWPLAAYELDELAEGFEDAVRFHPTHKASPVPIAQVIEKIMTQPLKDARAAVDARDAPAFAAAFDAVTDGCNRCHQATDFGFNAVVRPPTNPYPNQVFIPPQAADAK
ncbi:MAG: hypothetical protein Q7J25_03275 [Vicinamibacterales bacterium]|nr:hypothetical protein [Vicinamibacterales bacterium]